jgi:hypothetical protein
MYLYMQVSLSTLSISQTFITVVEFLVTLETSRVQARNELLNACSTLYLVPSWERASSQSDQKYGLKSPLCVRKLGQSKSLPIYLQIPHDWCQVYQSFITDHYLKGQVITLPDLLKQQ